MSSSTSVLALTKPASSEAYSLDVWNGNMQKIDDFAKTTDIYTINYSGNDAYIQYYKKNGVVYVFVYYKVSVGSIATWSTKELGTIPSGFRPKQTLVIPMVTDRSSSAGCSVAIQSNGLVYINGRYSGASDSTDILQTTACYPVA